MLLGLVIFFILVVIVLTAFCIGNALGKIAFKLWCKDAMEHNGTPINKQREAEKTFLHLSTFSSLCASALAGMIAVAQADVLGVLVVLVSVPILIPLSFIVGRWIHLAIGWLARTI